MVALWAAGPRVRFTQLPVMFRVFPEGIHITAVRDGVDDLVGARVLRFDDTPAEQALRAMEYVTSRENQMELVAFGALSSACRRCCTRWG
jgi:hypothetical protein